MFSRFYLTPIRHYRSLSRKITYFSQPHLISHQKGPIFGPTRLIFRQFGTENGGNNPNREKPSSDLWKLTQERDNFGSLFGNNDVGINGVEEGGGDVAVDDWLKMRPEVETWDLKEDVLGVGDVRMVGGNEVGDDDKVNEKSEDDLVLQQEEEALLAVLKGPNRTFGDLVAASGITDTMLDSLIALKDFQNIDGLPPLTEIEDKRYEDSLKKSSRYEMELQKQEEAAKSRVRQVDEKGRAYGTGRRKCSISRVWIQPGEGKFSVNDKEFDVYFPMLDHRAALLRPLSETQTLGLWDIKCTVKGGGVSGQVGAIQLGISRALQNWEPGLCPPLRDAGFLTRDSRVVERKKPGKAKARKSFQWVKR